MRRVKATANWNCCPEKPGAMTFTSAGLRRIPKTTTAEQEAIRTADARRASRAARSFPDSDRTREKTGTNAADSAPSARSWRAKLERVNATKNASKAADAPNSAAVTISLASPSTRLASVPSIMTSALRTIRPLRCGVTARSAPLSRTCGPSRWTRFLRACPARESAQGE